MQIEDKLVDLTKHNLCKGHACAESSLLCAAAGVTKVSGICHEAISTTIALMVQQPIMGKTPS